MSKEIRLLIGERLYTYEPGEACLVDVTNKNNRIYLSEMKSGLHFYSEFVDNATGAIAADGSPNAQTEILIPKHILEEGYEEGSAFADNFNRRLSGVYGIRLIDRDVQTSVWMSWLKQADQKAKEQVKPEAPHKRPSGLGLG